METTGTKPTEEAKKSFRVDFQYLAETFAIVRADDEDEAKSMINEAFSSEIQGFAIVNIEEIPEEEVQAFKAVAQKYKEQMN